jgi:hypothetical protein
LNKVIRASLMLLALVLLATLFACPKFTPESQRTVEEKVSVPGMEEALIARDRAIATAVTVSLHADPEIAQNEITVECRSAKVVLKGSVPTQEIKDRAEKLARAQEDVRDVLNELKVDPTLIDKRFFLDDQENPAPINPPAPPAPPAPKEPSFPDDDIGG